jgi:hypothetical protein
MRTLLRTRAVGSVLLGLATAAAPAGHATASGSARGPRPAACTITDGTSTNGGATRGANPVKYEFGNSPYVGARFDSCADVIKVYYGGYTAESLTHYNVTRGFGSYSAAHTQSELKAGPAMVWTVTPRDHFYETFTVQGCRRGSFLRPSSCTRWSPTITVKTPR